MTIHKKKAAKVLMARGDTIGLAIVASANGAADFDHWLWINTAISDALNNSATALARILQMGERLHRDHPDMAVQAGALHICQGLSRDSQFDAWRP